MSFRTHYCGNLNKSHVGTKSILCGWVHSVRDHGGVIFIDLRDRSGLVQVVFNPNLSSIATSLKPEYVLKITGTVSKRPEGTENLKLSSGEIEVVVENVEILNTSKTPVFELSDFVDVSEESRLKYRYLDLRRNRLQKNLLTRDKVYQLTRKHFSDNSFVEVETPFLTKSTPEGARDFLVPSRLHPAKFYALPQSPQLFKQILMVGGLERYFQIARCFRDEDLRADRQLEFTQIDVEMSFVTEDDVISISESLIKTVFDNILNINLNIPFKRISYNDAMLKYGSDKPDLRIPLEIVDITNILTNCQFKVFANVIKQSGVVRTISVPNGAQLSRQQIDNYILFVTSIGGKGMAWFKVTAEGALESNITKFFTPEELKNIKELSRATPGDIIFVIAGKPGIASTLAGELRLKVATDLNLFDKNNPWQFTWVVDFPLLEYSEEDKRWVAKHHPFTSANDTCWDFIQKIVNSPELLNSATDMSVIRARAYDLVLNGNEIGGGSIRIHQSEKQELMFKLLRLSPEEYNERFGFLLEALSFGAPPHGGIAFGLDRIIALLCGEPSIRDTIAFPKTQRGICPMTNAPDSVAEKQFRELHIKPNIVAKKNDDKT